MPQAFSIILHLGCCLLLFALQRRYAASCLLVFALIIQPVLFYISYFEDYSVVGADDYPRFASLVGITVLFYTVGVILHAVLPKRKLKTPTQLRWHLRIDRRMLALLAFASIIGFWKWWSQISSLGITLIQLMIFRGIESAENISFYSRWLASWMVIIAMLVAADTYSLRKRAGPLLYLSCGLGAALLIIQGGRMALLNFMAVLLLIKAIYKKADVIPQTHGRKRERRSGKRRLLSNILVAAAAVGILGGITAIRSATNDADLGDRGFMMLLNGSYGGVDSTIFILNNQPNLKDDLPTFLDWLWAPVPRSVWPEKPSNLGERVGAEMGLDIKLGGPTVNTYGELFRFGSWAGVIFGMMVVGFLAGMLDQQIRCARSNITLLAWLIVYVYGILNIWIISTSDIIVQTIMMLIPVAIVTFFGGRVVMRPKVVEPRANSS